VYKVKSIPRADFSTVDEARIALEEKLSDLEYEALMLTPGRKATQTQIDALSANREYAKKVECELLRFENRCDVHDVYGCPFFEDERDED
jgi:hypothetical protein